MLHQCLKNVKALFYGILKIFIFCLLTKKNSFEEGLLENSYQQEQIIKYKNYLQVFIKLSWRKVYFKSGRSFLKQYIYGFLELFG